MLDSFFNPDSVAVIGASREPGKVGYEILRNILASGYKGKVYPINPNAIEIQGIKCYPSILDVPENIDLGVVTLPASLVTRITKEAATKGLKGLVVVSAGFKEAGSDGTKLEREITDICQRVGMRLLGPNCLGFIDTTTPLNASFAPSMPRSGGIAFVSQSGALGTAILDWAVTERMGFSKFVSLGNKADLNECDVMEALADDEETRVILLYIESVTDGTRFLKTASMVTQKKPVIALKSGVSAAGARAASSHTGAMAGSDLVFNIAFAQTGVMRVNTAEELFDLAEAFSMQPIPAGSNVAIVTNAGGPGILATDACEKFNLKVAPVKPEMVEKLRGKLPPAAGFFNPIDLLGDAPASRYKFAMETMLDSSDVDSLLVILTPQAMTEPVETAKAVIEVATVFRNKPITASFIGGRAVQEAIALLEEAQIPCYQFPESAVQAIAELTKYGQRVKTTRLEKFPDILVNRQKAAEILKSVRADERLTLFASEASQLASAYGIPTPMIELATTADEAVLAASRLGYPVVLKIESPQILHKSDIGGVKLNVASEEDVRRSFYELVGRARIFYPSATVIGVNIQKMMPQGREMIVGMTRDVTFGPMIMFGLGGIYVNFLKDVAFRLAPLSHEAAVDMIQETKAYTLLRGIRGEAASDIDSVVDILLRISKLVTDFPEINELDINPLLVYEKGKGSLALDFKVVIAH